MKLSKWPLWDDDGEMLQKKFLLLILLSQTSSLPYDDVRGFLFFPRTFTKCVYTRVPPRFVVWTSSGRNLLFEFYFTKSIRKLEPMWQKLEFILWHKICANFSQIDLESHDLSWQWDKQKRISLLLCRS